MADMQAGQALQAGEREQQRSRLSTGQLKSKQIASMAANGIALDGGTANAVLTSTDVLGEVDANTIEQNALMSAWGYRTEAAMGRARAKAISPKMAAATTLLGSATQVASSWYSMNKGGLFAGADVTKANLSNDPIGSLGKSRGWWSS